MRRGKEDPDYEVALIGAFKQRLENDGFRYVMDFDANNSKEAQMVGEMREKCHSKGKSTTVIFVMREFKHRMFALFVKD